MLRTLRFFALANVVVLFLVVIAGAVVRATGSGMGCPDWPKCFGRLIPPTDVSQIPPEFMEKFLTEGHGNLLHTWVEFINRLLGATSGLLGLITLILAYLVRPRIPKAAVTLAVGLVAFAVVAWLGKVVVDTSLAPQRITIHMLGGLFLVSTAIAALVTIGGRPAIDMTISQRRHLWIALIVVLLQIVAGTRVREIVDQLPEGGCCDGRLEAALGTAFVIHRTGAWLVVTVVATLFFRLRFSHVRESGGCLLGALGALMAAEYGSGVILFHFGLPAFVQPAHLLMAMLIHGVLLSLILRARVVNPLQENSVS